MSLNSIFGSSNEFQAANIPAELLKVRKTLEGLPLGVTSSGEVVLKVMVVEQPDGGSGAVTSVNGYTGTVTGAQSVAGANIAPGLISQTLSNAQTWTSGPQSGDAYTYRIALNGLEKFALNNAGALNVGGVSIGGSQLSDASRNVSAATLTVGAGITGGSRTIGTLPNPGDVAAGTYFFVTNASGGASYYFSDGVSTWYNFTRTVLS